MPVSMSTEGGMNCINRHAAFPLPRTMTSKGVFPCWLLAYLIFGFFLGLLSLLARLDIAPNVKQIQEVFRSN